MVSASLRRTYERWLKELTSIPTAAGCEDRVVEWIHTWVNDRRDLQLRHDKAGNLFITKRQSGRKSRKPKPIFITAHLDHPAFVVRRILDERTVELEFRGGVHDKYFANKEIEIYDRHGRCSRGRIILLNSKSKPFKRVEVRLVKKAVSIEPGDVGRWTFGKKKITSQIKDGVLYAPACDDLAAVAAALAMLDQLRNRKGMEHVGLIFTLAEEIGFIGAIAACRNRSMPKSARLICLENSRSYAESPIGGGPILRVGDKSSVFNPALTNQLGMILTEYQRKKPNFKWQRRLMPGGSCEATAFSAYGFESTCVCLPLGNYHNMIDVDRVLAGKRQPRIGMEFISIEDYHGLIDLLAHCVKMMDHEKMPTLSKRMEQLYKEYGFVLDE